MTGFFANRRYLAVALPRLRTDRLRRRGLGVPPPSEPVAVAATAGPALVLAAVDEAAAALGLRPGLSVTEARARFPALAVVPADPAADAALLDAVADWCRRYTPLAATEPPDGVTLDITGCAHLFGGEAALARDLLRRLRQQGFAAEAALAPAPAAAWALARFGRIRSVGALDELPEAMAPLPLAALKLDPESVAALARIGLRSIGDLAEKPRAPLAARFGAGLMARLDAVLGRAVEPISPRLEAAPYVAERRFPEPAIHEAEIAAAIEALAQHLATLLVRHGEGARRLELTLFRTGGEVLRLEVGAGEPLSEGPRIAALFAQRIAGLADPLDPGFGFDLVRLAALAVERRVAEEPDLEQVNGEGDVTRLVEALSARYGAGRVLRFEACDEHRPEDEARLRPAIAGPVVAGAFAAPGEGPGERAPERPLRLLERPEPVEALAAVPDGPPVRFRWRRAMHQVRAAEGPERIASSWWRETPEAPTRDYFRVEDTAGRRFWLYREGLYEREVQHPRWWLHGFFA